MPTTGYHKTPRTTIALSKNTKTRLDKNRAPGQCYDGFLSQLVDLWEREGVWPHAGEEARRPHS